jgi:putative acyl-CoA dehydrogenase
MQHDSGVINLPTPLTDANLVTTDEALVDALEAWEEEPIVDGLTELGDVGATAEAREHARLANAHPPMLAAFDAYGRRIDEVEYHPSWHWLMRQATGFGLHASAWVEGVPQAHLRRAAGFYAWSQVEAGHSCPISMTYAALPVLQTDPEVAEQWIPLLASRLYDPALVEPAAKSGALAGMATAEKQGGSDVRTNVTRATLTASTCSVDTSGSARRR